MRGAESKYLVDLCFLDKTPFNRLQTASVGSLLKMMAIIDVY